MKLANMRSAGLVVLLGALSACGSGAAAPASSPGASPSTAAAPASAAAKPASSPAAASAKPASSGAASAPAKPSASASSSAAAKPSGPAIKLATGTGSPTTVFAYVADDQGLYAKHGVNVSTQTMSGQSQMEAVIAGEAQATVHAGADLVFTSEAAGQDLKIVFTGSRVDDDVLLAGNNIKTVEDLRGKKLGAQSSTSVNGQMARRLLAKHGLQEGKDYQVILTGTQGSTAGALAALLSGQIDATAVSQAQAAEALKQGKVHVVEDIAARTDLPVGSQVLVFQSKFVQANPDAVQKTVDALIDAVHVVFTDKNATEASLKKVYKITDQGELDDAWARLKQVLAKDPTPSRDDFADSIAALPKDASLTDAQINGMIEPKFVKDAISRGLTNF